MHSILPPLQPPWKKVSLADTRPSVFSRVSPSLFLPFSSLYPRCVSGWEGEGDEKFAFTEEDTGESAVVAEKN